MSYGYISVNLTGQTDRMAATMGRRSVLVSSVCGEEESGTESSSSSEKECVKPSSVPQQSSIISYIPSSQGYTQANQKLNNEPLQRIYNAYPMTEISSEGLNTMEHSIPTEMSLMRIHNMPAVLMHNSKKKKPQPFPEEYKDDLYWERRKRNNESAKKSRALRKMKEQQISFKVLHLEQENLQLKTEVTILKQELEKLQKFYQKSAVENS